MTYDDDRLATGYGYIVDSRLDELDAMYQSAKAGHSDSTAGAEDAPDAAIVRRIIDSLDERGAWVESGRLRHHKVEPIGGVINGATYSTNVAALARYLKTYNE
ncbi:MAG: hypothetical protein M3552_06835 [Planctomycetota bacterium]|nr:hypothetical protein [Planctomycetaceae bacterium]MDQ3330352.1 hypothetical protein [Planctomycetota bacterium]